MPPSVVDSKPWSTVVRVRLGSVPRDLRVLTLAVVAFLGLGALFSRATGASFVVPRGESPVLGTEASVPLIVTLAVYLVARLARCARMGSARAGGEGLERIRIDLYLLALFAAVMYVHFHLKMWIPLVNDRSFDPVFFAIDDRLRVLIEGLQGLRSALARVMPAPDIWYDVFFFSMFSLSFWSHTLGPRRFLHHNMVAITLVELIGPLLYLIAPAVGPFLFEAGANPRASLAQQRMYEQFTALREGGVGWADVHGAAYFTAPLAAMPSLHLAATCVLAYYAVRARLVIAPYAVFAAAWIGVEAVVARWHYLVDLPAGLLVAAIAIYTTNRLCRFRLAAGVPVVEAHGATTSGWALPAASRREA